MVNEDLLIVFAKNAEPGKVKTRLARSIGDEDAYRVYLKLLEITSGVVNQLNDIDVNICFTDHIDLTNWGKAKGSLQKGSDLGERMANAFREGFEEGYQRVICIGTDLPDLNKELIMKAFDHFESDQVVIGPSSDGGYYLIGMDQCYPFIFENKTWSTDAVLDKTVEDLQGENMRFSLLEELNDIDTIEDFRSSSIYSLFK